MDEQKKQETKRRTAQKWSPPKRTPDDEPIIKIAERHLKPAEAARQIHHIEVPAGTTKEALLNPRSYSHIARRLVSPDEIVVMADDASFYARFLVLFSDTLQTMVVCLDWHDLAAVEVESEDPRFFVKHFPNRDIRWAVIRRADNHRMAQGFGTREQAHAWIGKNAARNAA